MKVGIVTFNNAYNYGAFLQAYALQESIKKLNHEVEIIDYQKKSFNLQYRDCQKLSSKEGWLRKLKLLLRPILKYKKWKISKVRNKKFENSIKNNFLLSEDLLSNIDDIETNFDYFISGSDQVWNLELTQNDNTYFLDFVKNNKKKLSYAASFGKDTFSDELYSVMESYLPQYKKLLVREKTGKDILKNRFNLESEVVLDPTLLLNKDEWTSFSVKPKGDRRYVLVYTIKAPTNLPKIVIEYAQKHNLDIVIIGVNTYFKDIKNKVNVIQDADPHEFIGYFLNAEIVFTTSFHGFVLSLNLNKQFYYELSKDTNNTNSRISDISSEFGLDNQEIRSDNLFQEEINWSLVNEKLFRERERSIKLLKEMIEAN